MSAAVTAFYDVRDVLLQNQKNLDRRPFDDLTVDKLETAAAMISKLQQRHQLQLQLQLRGSPVIGNRDLLLSGRRLDRSISEPVGCDPKRVLSSAAQQQQQQNAQNAQNARNVNSSRYKTELCRPFEENGYCKYGDKCQFAHGSHELRSLARHPKYKTELCRTFHTIGFCPYGPRCHFIHNEDERRLSQINQLKQQISPCATPTHMNSSQQQQVQRPRALNFTLPLVRDSLGSTGDSPPSSISDSPPSTSPTWLNEDFLGVHHHRYSPPASAPAANLPAFTFPADPAMAPLNVDTFASLTAGLNALSLNNSSSTSSSTSSASSTSSETGFAHLRDALDVFCPPSPPDSLGSDDIARGLLRLPIFSQISTE